MYKREWEKKYKAIADRDQYSVYDATEEGLTLHGGGDFYNNDGAEPDEETWEQARSLAALVGKRITGGEGRWYGWIGYTPDPGSVSFFTWEDA